MTFNWAEAHLWINHLPVFGVLFGLALLVYAMARREEEAKRAALIRFVITALGTIPAYMTGDPAEHIVRSMPEVDQAMIDQHSNWGTASLILIEAVGVASLAGLWLSYKSGGIPPTLIQGTLALALVAFFIVAWTSHLGGQVHHPETRRGFVPPPRMPRSRPLRPQ